MVVPKYLADAFEDRANWDGLCAEEAVIRLLADWVNDPEPKTDRVDLPKVLYEVEQGLASDGCANFIRARYGTTKLRRCRNCGIRVAKSQRILPWKACSEDCADELWIRANCVGDPE
ncbi:hypothetical protein GCM10009851_05350 [Herbiconiux moechotypicola]|uniref:Uncharacterized protein n=1 Tax=Herbiconiux moechotypicola TaxID=637393 RepID=A0ABP5Q6K0_9MICO